MAFITWRYMTFIMKAAEKLQIRKEQRKENRSKVRQALFISDYLRYKNFVIYQEAASFYNRINSDYPSKPDLRKTDEFKAWKMGIPMRPKKVPREKSSHEPIPMMDGNSFTLICQEAASPDKPVSPEQHSSQKVMQLRIPLMKPSVTTQIVTEEVLNEKPLQVATEEIAMEPTIPYPSLDEEIPDEIVTEKPLQVAAEEIAMEPTIPYPSLDEEIPNEIVTEKPLQVAAEEIAMESTTLYPSLDEEIPDEILERIINELREDPELRTVMTNIEQELEFEQLGCDLDIPEDIRLENSMQW